ncbi:MAG: RecQ family ATP-dependent DNA helicase [Thiocapsa sp.]|uniref:RecQ family ATP-dependent DNA helicase n=1 Tax=Thiocapsa sp. TaxID=2024551 RepID=UPI001BCEA912|nr:RecQ family ATP-dependent DNA helicase [Thiocapsa sp.]QVL46951.1 MAG: RecQ family ATP-dependent DNA helicase [Thiocapsa sp.]
MPHDAPPTEPPPSGIDSLIERSLLLDLETGPDGAIHKIGAIRQGREFRRQGRFDPARTLDELERFAGDASFVVGHNLLGHDLPTLRARAPSLDLLGRRIIDTLYLSPLAFPANPYHRLVKDYKLVRDSVADPVQDCRLAEQVLREQFDELVRRCTNGIADDTSLIATATSPAGAVGTSAEGWTSSAQSTNASVGSDLGGLRSRSSTLPAVVTNTSARGDEGGERDLIRVFQFCFRGATLLEANATGGDGLAAVFRLLSGELPSVTEVRETLLARWQGRACSSVAPRLILDHLSNPDRRPILAYAAAWLQVAGGSSVLPPWVRHRFPATVTLLKALRDTPCEDPICAWCREVNDPRAQLARWFGFDAFRAEPQAQDGGSLQEIVVRDGIADRSLLAILPTGGGKSLCFQLPALVRAHRRGTLSVVISPLQALMKDQVDNLVKKTGATSAAAIYGLLTPPERGEVMERVRLGDIALLYISPEQLRNRSVADVLASREIGCWIFDEAHCLSKWGHDFRPDYLYAGRFIRTLAGLQGVPVTPVACFTATAKRDVKTEILAYFREELGLDLVDYTGGVERDNLEFEVQVVGKHEKDARIHAILTDHLGAPRSSEDPDPTGGAAVVYASTRKGTEALAERLGRQGWAVEAFHAGISAPEKKRIQESFVTGELQVICATNAFGMGVDKEDVRLVVHADIPGSLESYIQEAGRAGRDRKPAACVLLYDEQDIESQFRMESFSELSRRDIAEILRGVRRAKRDREGVVVVTSGELLRDEDLRLGFDPEATDADTRVRIAIAWLERAGLVERNENRTFVFQGRPAVASLEDAERKIRGLGLSAAQGQRWLAILEAMLNTDPDDTFSADELARLPAFDRAANGQAGTPDPNSAPVPPWDRGDTPSQRVLRTLHDMAGAGLLRDGPQLTAFVSHKVKNHSALILARVARLERAMLEVLREQDPDAQTGVWLPLSLRRLNQHLLDQGHDSNPETLRTLLKGLTLDGRGLAGARGSLDLRQTDRDHYRLRLHRDWPTLHRTAERRRAVADRILKALLAKLPDDAPANGALLVAFGTEELTGALRGDLALAAEVRDPLAAVHRGLLFLHEHGAITLQNGFAVFRSAMTLRLLPQAKGRRYSEAQYQPLAQHYRERVFQIHVMNEYARLGAEKIRQALNLVTGYFTLGKEAFVKRWLADRREQLLRATTAESFRRIVEDLGNPEQIEIVAAPEDGNRLVLAGPGSGKTRVIVHRCAFLLRVLRVPAHRILVLCFNRGAALELRRRLAELVGDDARGVTVQTYHGFAMRLTGRSYAERLAATTDAAPDFDGLIGETVDLLEGRVDLPGIEPDEARERLLAGYRHILVDEYQDIDADQYRLVAAIAGRTVDEDKLTLLAVGDDDQSIYAFRGANVECIRRFKEDYAADLHHLVENYRSTGHIVAAANALIAHNRERMKRDHPIRVDRRRTIRPASGHWQDLDGHAKGRVLLLGVADPPRQAAALVARIEELRRLGGHDWSDIAVLARRHVILEPVRALCEHKGIPVDWPGDLPPLHRVREIDAFLNTLAQHARKPMSARALLEWLPERPSPWRSLLQRLIADWTAEAGTTEVPAAEIAEFCYETLAEQRRDRRLGEGLLLTTLHGAKGLEFPHVILADGAWDTHSDNEEERRLFYVGMTRAKETLTLMAIAGSRHPYLAEIEGDWLIKAEPVVQSAPAEVIGRRYTRLTPADLDLGYAGRMPPDAAIHRHLAALGPDDDLRWEQIGQDLFLLDQAGHRIGRLSKRTAARWLPDLDRIERIRVAALIRRDSRQNTPEHALHCRSEHWEVPLVEIRWRGS